jgi:hypothetical protein
MSAQTSPKRLLASLCAPRFSADGYRLANGKAERNALFTMGAEPSTNPAFINRLGESSAEK